MKRVYTLDRLVRLANERRAVISPRYGPLFRHRPAAFVIGWTGRMINDALQAGIYVYERKQK